MSDDFFKDTSHSDSNVELLVAELSSRHKQINSLLELTQGINSNKTAEELFDIYQKTLNDSMGIRRLVCYIPVNGRWTPMAHRGVRDAVLNADMGDALLQYDRTATLFDDPHPVMQLFDVVIPVYHKSRPIAFAVLGDVNENDKMYEKVQFITTLTNIIAVAIENKRLFKRQLEQERLKKEMEVAQNVQQMLIPKELPSNDQYELDSIYMPHLGVGGDYFDYIKLSDEEFAFCIGDISGKGVGAALLMANFQANLRTLVGQRLEKEAFIQQLNTKLLDITKGERFITFFYAEYHIGKRELRYINAGHNPPMLIQSNRAYLLDKGCTLLGTFDHIPTIELGVIDVLPNALIVAYTDGITDLQNNRDEYFEVEILRDFAIHHAHVSAHEFNLDLMEFMNEFRGDKPFPDDLSVLTCKVF